MKKIVLIVLCFLAISGLVYSASVPLVHPLTNKPGFWVSEDDMTAIIQAFDMVVALQGQVENTLVVNETLTLNLNVLVDDYNNLKSKVGILWGVTLGIGVGTAAAIIMYSVLAQGGK